MCIYSHVVQTIGFLGSDTQVNVRDSDLLGLVK